MAQLEIFATLTETPDEARRRAAATIASATDQPGGVSFVRGMPGSGVSSMLRKVCEEHEAAGLQQVTVALDVYEKDTPYGVSDLLVSSAPHIWAVDQLCRADLSPAEIARRFTAQLVEWQRAGGSNSGNSPESDSAPSSDEVPIASEEPVAPERRSALVISVDNIEWADTASVGLLRYAVPRLVRHGVQFVFGHTLSEPTELASFLAKLANHDPNGYLVTMPALSSCDIISLVEQRAGIGVAKQDADVIRQKTDGRYGAVTAYLSGVSAELYDDLAALRSVTVNARMRMTSTPNVDLEALTPTTRIAAKVCAMTESGVSIATVEQLGRALKIETKLTQAADGDVVVRNSLTGLLHLRDPLTAPEIVDDTNPETRRVIHRVLADSTYGREMLIHSASAIDEYTDATHEWVLATAADLEARQQGRDAVAFLDAASRLDILGDYEKPLLRAFGLACVRNMQGVWYLDRLHEFAESDDPVFRYVYGILRTYRAHGRLDAQALRIAYVREQTQSVEHELLQAHMAWYEFVSSVQTGGDDVVNAFAIARPLLAALEGREIVVPELAYIDPKALGVFADCFALVGKTYGEQLDPTLVTQLAHGLGERALALPKEADSIDALTMLAVLLVDVHDVDAAVVYLAEARQRQSIALRPTLLPGQLDIVDAIAKIRRGEWVDARALLGEALDRVLDGLDMPSRVVVPALAGWLELLMGDYEVATRLIKRAEAANRYRFEGYGTEMLALAKVDAKRLRDGPAAALEMLSDYLDDPHHSGSMWIAALQLELKIHCSDGPAATEAYERLLAQVRARSAKDVVNEFAWVGGAVAQVNNDHDRAIEIFTAALEDAYSEYVRGRCYFGLAMSYEASRGWHPQVEECLTQAETTFSRMQAKLLVDLTHQRREQINADRQARRDSLTARELQVANLAARGWTNKEIARELQIGVATVAFHMSNVLTKLAVPKRAHLELALR